MYLSKTSYKVIRCSDTTKTAITASAIFVFACFLRFSTKYGFIIKSVHVTQPKPSGWHSLNSLWFHGCCAHKTTNRNDLITFIFDLDWWERMIQTEVNEYSTRNLFYLDLQILSSMLNFEISLFRILYQWCFRFIMKPNSYRNTPNFFR